MLWAYRFRGPRVVYLGTRMIASSKRPRTLGMGFFSLLKAAFEASAAAGGTCTADWRHGAVAGEKRKIDDITYIRP